MVGKSKHKNVVVNLRNREYSHKPCLRNDYMTLRHLICEGNYIYKKVWEKHSNKSISCEGEKIYFDNYSSCYGGYTLDLRPKHLYMLHMPMGVKIEDAVVSSTQPESIPLSHQGHLESIICLTNKSHLIRYELTTGKILQEIYLSPRFKFRHIAWNNPNVSFVVKSTHSKMTNLARQAGIGVPILMVLAVFEVYPIEFVGMVEISKQVFGKDIIDATISQGILITLHQTNLVRMYSFERIIEEYRMSTPKLYEEMDDIGHACGCQPIGIPCNIQITECPPVLFEVKCADHIVEIGGIPWHYLISPPKCRGYFNVLSLASRTLADNGILDSENFGIEPDKALFCPDESGRILHIGASEIRMLKICEGENGNSIIKECFKINMENQGNYEKNKYIPFTSSGRTVRRKTSIDEVTECPNLTIHNVDYEIDLDLLFVSAVYHEPDSNQGVLSLYNGYNNYLYKTIKLEEPYLEFYEHNVYIDLDTIIQIIKPTPSKFCTIVYRLSAVTNDDDTQETNHNKKQSNSSSSTSSANRRRRRRTR